MQLLALDTTTRWCSVALWRDGEVLAREADAGQSHSEQLLPMVDALLGQAGTTLGRLDAIAFGAGPGSFTGLRIACAVAQGLGFGAGLPLVPVGSLAALAEGARRERGATLVYASLDARMREVYAAAFEHDGAVWRERIAPLVVSPVAAPLPDGAGWHGCGDGFAAEGGALRERLGAVLAALEGERVPLARDVAALGAAAYARGEAVAAEHATPVYVRDKVALTAVEQRRGVALASGAVR
jgi:tRNA threonylcarbamoyladenosine biosynthesis protein TsaB